MVLQQQEHLNLQVADLVKVVLYSLGFLWMVWSVALGRTEPAEGEAAQGWLNTGASYTESYPLINTNSSLDLLLLSTKLNDQCVCVS